MTMHRLLPIILCFLCALGARAQFVVTPVAVSYVTNGAQVSARCTYFLHPDRTYIGEQVDASGRRIRVVGLAALTTGGGTVTHHWQIQSSTVLPIGNIALFRIVDTTGASASRVAEQRDIPLSIYPPSANLVPTGTPTYKTALSKGIFSLTAERKFGEWLLLEEWRNRVWSPARWMPLGGKSSVLLGSRYIGTGEPPVWRVSTWKTGPPPTTPPLPPGFTLGAAPAGDQPQPAPEVAAARFTFAPASVGQGVIDNSVITNGLYWISCRQGPDTELLVERAPLNGAGLIPPWTPLATFGCYPFASFYIVTAPTNFVSFFVRARNVPCAPGFSPASAGLGLGALQRVDTPWGNLGLSEIAGLNLGDGVKAYQVNP